MNLFVKFASRVIQDGTLIVEDVHGAEYQFGDNSGSPVKIKLHSRIFPWKLLLNPGLMLPEGYVDGDLTIQQGTIRELLEILKRNYARYEEKVFRKPQSLTQRLLRYVHEHNPIGKAQKNVSHHYDLDTGLYDLFLDADKQYSCAYFTHPDASLEAAQLAKKRHLAAKLRIGKGQRVLDIGCGWGGLAIYLAQRTGASVLGVTLSREQHNIASERVRQMGMEKQVEVRLQDYRKVEESFDRIVSVGMFEHVGVKHYSEFFRVVHDRLEKDGIALLHTIGQLCTPRPTHPWIRKYIFPGGALPSLSQIFPHVEQSGLITSDIEVLRLHYAKTLEHWADRFEANRDKVSKLYDERFCRMWEIYLNSCIFSFRYNYLVNFQIQMTKRLQSLPICRDYMVDWEREEENSHEPPLLARRQG